MRKVLGFTALVCIAFSSPTLAQTQPERATWALGTFIGVGHSKISNLKATILSEPTFTGYKMFEERRNAGILGVYFAYRFKNARGISPLGLQHEISYSHQGGNVVFNNYTTDFNYKIKFKYQYFNVNTLFSYFRQSRNDKKDHDFRFGAGLQIGFNLFPDEIHYESGGSGRLPAFGEDWEQTQQLRNVLTPYANIGFLFVVTYCLKIPVAFDVRYFAGWSDVLKTEPNSYNFIPNNNKNNAYFLTVSYQFARSEDN
jgi:hypothetical protein